MQYTILLARAGNNYSAHCPDVPGCAAVGDTIEEAVESMRDALAFHFEGMAEDGDPIPRPASLAAVVDVTLPDEGETSLGPVANAAEELERVIEEAVERLRQDVRRAWQTRLVSSGISDVREIVPGAATPKHSPRELKGHGKRQQTTPKDLKS